MCSHVHSRFSLSLSLPLAILFTRLALFHARSVSIYLHLVCKWNYFNYFVCGEFWLFFASITRYKTAACTLCCYLFWLFYCCSRLVLGNYHLVFSSIVQIHIQTLTHTLDIMNHVCFVRVIVVAAHDADAVCLLCCRKVLIMYCTLCVISKSAMTCEWQRRLDAWYDIVCTHIQSGILYTCTQCTASDSEWIWSRKVCHFSAQLMVFPC